MGDGKKQVGRVRGRDRRDAGRIGFSGDERPEQDRSPSRRGTGRMAADRSGHRQFLRRPRRHRRALASERQYSCGCRKIAQIAAHSCVTDRLRVYSADWQYLGLVCAGAPNAYSWFFFFTG